LKATKRKSTYLSLDLLAVSDVMRITIKYHFEGVASRKHIQIDLREKIIGLPKKDVY